MKNLSIFQSNESNTNHDIDHMIDINDAQIKKTYYEEGKHKGTKGPVLGERLSHHLGFKSSYESLLIKALQKLQPQSQIAEGEMDKSAADKHSKQVSEEIEKARRLIAVHKKELGDFDHKSVNSRIIGSLLAACGIFLGETVINTSAFAVTGDNLLSTMILSASVSFAISLGAHFAGREYKESETKAQKRRIVLICAIGVTAISAVIASLRSMFWQKMGVDINPIFFTIFNMVFFLAAATATRYIHPYQSEIEKHRENSRKHKLVVKMEKETNQKERELALHEKSSREMLKVNLRALVYAEYAIERIQALYRECFGTYKEAYMLCSKVVPECFSEPLPPLDIPQINFMSIIKKYKTNENENNPYPAV